MVGYSPWGLKESEEVLAVFPLWNNLLGQMSDWDVSETQGPKIIFSF